MFKGKLKRLLIVISVIIVLSLTFALTASAESGDVAGAIEKTWLAAKTQVQDVVNKVVFPVVDMILAVMFFVKIGTSYFEYRRNGQFEFTAPCILFVCLVFTLTAPLYIWTII